MYEHLKFYYYMAVTPDKYELPLIVEDSIQDLAEKCGVSRQTISKAIKNDTINEKNHCKFRKVKRLKE